MCVLDDNCGFERRELIPCQLDERESYSGDLALDACLKILVASKYAREVVPKSLRRQLKTLFYEIAVSRSYTAGGGGWW